MRKENQDHIILRGLRQNNLKNVSLDIPKGKVCFFSVSHVLDWRVEPIRRMGKSDVSYNIENGR